MCLTPHTRDWILQERLGRNVDWWHTHTHTHTHTACVTVCYLSVRRTGWTMPRRTSSNSGRCLRAPAWPFQSGARCFRVKSVSLPRFIGAGCVFLIIAMNRKGRGNYKNMLFTYPVSVRLGKTSFFFQSDPILFHRFNNIVKCCATTQQLKTVNVCVKLKAGAFNYVGFFLFL